MSKVLPQDLIPGHSLIFRSQCKKKSGIFLTFYDLFTESLCVAICSCSQYLKSTFWQFSFLYSTFFRHFFSSKNPKILNSHAWFVFQNEEEKMKYKNLPGWHVFGFVGWASDNNLFYKGSYWFKPACFFLNYVFSRLFPSACYYFIMLL